MELLKALEDIQPTKLCSSSYLKCVQQLTNTLSTSIISDSTNLLLLIQTIKDCKSACFKRDTLLDALDQIFSPSNNLLEVILCNIIQTDSDRDVVWKEISNSLVSLPDLVANCDSLKKFPRFKSDTFFSHLLSKLNKTLDKRNYKINQICFIVQIIGRIAISGYSSLVWEKFTSKLINHDDNELRDSIAKIFTFPLHDDNQISSQFEMYIEPLYFPIFSNLKPTRRSGNLIQSILGDKIRNHHFFEYILCNKSILQTNYILKRHRQQQILFNIFSYLANLSDTASNEGKKETKKETCSLVDDDLPKNNKLQRSNNLLIKTLLEVARSWSNETKILFRPYEQNRYITSALLIGFRYAFEKDKQVLAEHADEIQAKIIQGFPIYLNRASFKHRNLSMCLGEILLPKLCELIGSRLKPGKEKETLDFNVNWDDDSLSLKALINTDVEELFKENVKDTDNGDADNHHHAEKHVAGEFSCAESTGMNSKLDDEACALDEDEACESGEDEACILAEDKKVPIYLPDCIAGLIQNDNPNYVRLCLVKAIDQLNVVGKEIEKGNCDDAIRDIAIELAQALLYLDDQFNIENFDSFRMKAMCLLSTSCTDLVVKYLLDEYNGSTRNTRHQLEILQVLVKTAQGLPTTKFVKYVSLFFYGIIYQLKADILPLTIVSATKAAALSIHKDNKLDDSYLLSRIFFSISEIIKCVYQQPITCKLSNDLLDVLAAYRSHPDSGVRKSMISCLTVIKECTASVYFKECLYDKTVNLFDDWLAVEADLLELSRFSR